MMMDEECLAQLPYSDRLRRLLLALLGASICGPIFVLLMDAALGAEVVVPDPQLTPGVIASTDQNEVCGIVGGLSYSKRHRVTPPEMKAEVRQRYQAHRCGEIDHRLPLALGGADVVENLSCEIGPPEPWNFRVKDKLETFVWEAVCKRHTISLADGQAIFMEPDWRVPYCKLIGGVPC